VTMSRMANSRPMRTTSHTVTRRRLLTTGLATGLALTVPGVARAVPYDPENDDPDFHPVKFRLPAPSGRKALGTTAIHLVDQSRPDPAMPSGRRELMISLWYPASVAGSAPIAKYMPARTAVEVDDTWTGEYGLALPSGSPAARIPMPRATTFRTGWVPGWTCASSACSASRSVATRARTRCSRTSG
jgi:hypothetical protein